jgi:protein-L-isoaspartate(D-aspartate) O-methyltransferase
MIRVTQDTYFHKGLRKKLIDSLRAKGIKDEQVLEAMNEVPRHYFLDQALVKIAYEDRAFPIANGQTISQPYTVAFQSELLEIKKYDKVLEVGTGSAYQATILGALGAQVYTIERQQGLYKEVKKYYPFKSKYPLIKFFYGDGYKGLPTYGPFDKIIITAGAPSLPEKLLEQLKPNGILVAPLGEGEEQIMTRYKKGPKGGIKIETFGEFSFVPMLQGVAGK